MFMQSDMLESLSKDVGMLYKDLRLQSLMVAVQTSEPSTSASTHDARIYDALV